MHDTFLEPYLPRYKEAQASCKSEQFWKEVNNAFNEKWPPKDAGERKKVYISLFSVVVHIANYWQNLQSWFNNKGRVLPRKNAKTNLFQLKEHKTNKLRHNFQAFSKLYYEDCIREHAEKEFTNAIAAFEQGKRETKLHSLMIRQAVTKAMYQEADAAMQLKAQQFCANWNKAINEGRDPLEEEDTDSEEDDEEREE